MIRKMDAFIGLGSVGESPYTRRGSSSYRIGKIVGYIMVIAVVILVVVRLARRSSIKPGA
jgi:hypothetical protein